MDWSEVDDQELVEAFLDRTRKLGLSQTEIERVVPGVTQSDVSRWTLGHFKRLSAEKRRAITAFLAAADEQDGADYADGVADGVRLAVSRMIRVIGDLVTVGSATAADGGKEDVQMRDRLTRYARRLERASVEANRAVARGSGG